MRTLFACTHCGAEFGEGEEDNGRCPHCWDGHGEPIGECPGDGEGSGIRGSAGKSSDSDRRITG